MMRTSILGRMLVRIHRRMHRRITLLGGVKADRPESQRRRSTWAARVSMAINALIICCSRTPISRFKYPTAAVIASSLLCTNACYAVDPRLSLSELHHTSWRSAEGAPNNIVAIAQTPDGYLWLGTGGGLYRFDGVQFQHVSTVAGQTLLSGSISALHATATGQLLIGHRFGGVTILDKGRLEHHTANGLPAGNAWAFAVDRAGDIWGAFSGGVARLRAGKWQRFRLDGEHLPFRTLVIDPEGRVWVTAKTGAYVLPVGADTFERVEVDLPSYPYLSLAPDGRVWAADFKRLRIAPIVHDGSRFTLSSDLKFPATGDQHWFDSGGALWIRTAQGVARVAQPVDPTGTASSPRQAAVEHFGKVEGLTGQLYCFLEDREGNIWLGTAGGLDRFRHAPVRQVKLGANDGSVGVAPGEGGDVWATTEFGGLYRVGEAVESIALVGSRGSHIHRDREGVLWVGSRSALWKIAGHSLPTEVPRPDAGDDPASKFAPIHAMAKDRSGALWVHLVAKGTYRMVEGRWTEVPKDLDTFIMSMGNDTDGRLWIGYIHRGAARVDGDEVKTYTARDGLDIGAVMSIFARGARVWFGGQRGVALFDGTAMRTVTFKGVGELSVVSGIVETASGQLWINAANGLTRIAAEEWQAALRDPEHQVRARRFDDQDGLLGRATQIRPLPSLIEAGDGKLWAALPGGLFVVDPSRMPHNSIAPPVIIEQMTMQAQRTSRRAFLPAMHDGTTDLHFQYAATSLTAPQRVQFQYMLEGYDEDWRDVGGRREASYTRVKPGHYTFRVKAANNDGVWNEQGAAMAFSVPPTFWQTGWFASLVVALAAAILWALYRFRIRSITKRVQERMSARMQERARIARELHDTLLQSITGLALHVRAAADQVPQGSPLRARLERALGQANRVIVEGRDRVIDLRVSGHLRLGLPTVLSNACNELSETFPGATCKLEVSGLERPIGPLVTDEAVHIAREAISNALRHSGCEAVVVSLRFGSDAVRLIVCDDGHGIGQGAAKVDTRPGHFGLAGMHERAASIGAQLHIHTSAKGTRVEVIIPAAIAYSSPRRSEGAGAASYSAESGPRQ